MKLLSLAGIMLLLISCADPYGAAAKTAADIAAGVGAGLSTVQSLHVSGTITEPEALNAAGYLKFVNDADGAFETCIGAAHTAATKTGAFTSCTQTFVTGLNNPTELALIHVANTQASQTLSAIASGFVTGLQTLSASLGGA